MKPIEQQIWDYIDGTCTEQEHLRIKHLIESDEEYKLIFEELEKANMDFSMLELEEPSMSFTRNVMEKVKLGPLPGKFKSLVDKRIIYGIAAFFVISILSLLVMSFSQIDWSQGFTLAVTDYKLPQLNVSSQMNKTLINSFLFLDLILGLYFLDHMLRKQLNSK